MLYSSKTLRNEAICIIICLEVIAQAVTKVTLILTKVTLIVLEFNFVSLRTMRETLLKFAILYF